jgi:pilus assembly protein CpaE
MPNEQSLSVVIVDRNDESRRKLEVILGSLPHVSVNETSDELQTGYRLIQQVRPQLVILNLDPNTGESIALLEKINAGFPGVNIIASSSNKQPDLILRAIRSGAHEFLVQPINTDELTSAVQKVVRAWLAKKTELAAPGKLISVFCTKGGYGTTTLAVNLATSLVPISERTVVIADLDLEAGDASTFLGITPKYTIANVTANLARADQAYLQSVLEHHSSGVYVLAEPERMEEAETITPTQIREILTMLKTMAGVTIVDTKKTFDDRTLMALDLSDIILLVTVLSIPAVRATQRTLEVFHRLGYHQDKVKLVVNRYLPGADIKIEDVERTLNYPISWQIANDFPAAMLSINRGQPVSDVAPNSEISISFKQLARDVAGITNIGAVMEKEARRGLFGRLFK